MDYVTAKSECFNRQIIIDCLEAYDTEKTSERLKNLVGIFN